MSRKFRLKNKIDSLCGKERNNNSEIFLIFKYKMNQRLKNKSSGNTQRSSSQKEKTLANNVYNL